jgi:hypothetical protein
MTAGTADGPDATGGETPRTADESKEERLAEHRAEVARLESELGIPAAEAGAVPARRNEWWRAVVVVVTLALVAIIAPVAVVATWAHDMVSDTNYYVDAVAPLASEPAVQNAVSAKISQEVLAQLDIPSLTHQVIDTLSSRTNGNRPRAIATLTALEGPLDSALASFVTQQVDRIVQSQAFADAWTAANRTAHTQLVAVLTGQTGSAVSVNGDKVILNLGSVVDQLKTQLVQAGFNVASRIPQIQTQITLVQSSGLAKAQSAFRLLKGLATALPIIALLLLGAAVAVSRRHRRTLVIGSVVVAASMLVLGLLLNLFRVVYLDAIPATTLPQDAAGAIYDQVIWSMRLHLRAVLVLFLAIAAVVWVTGPTGSAVALRQVGRRAVDSVQHRADRAGLDTGPVGAFLGQYRRQIEVTVAGIVVLLYVLRTHPTGGWTLGLILIAALVVLLVELFARPPVAQAEAAETSPPPPEATSAET